MRVGVSWLREYVDAPTEPDRLEAALVRMGLEVEEIIDLRTTVTGPLVLGRVDKLTELTGFKKPIRHCLVDVGGGQPQSIICGATNFAEGDLVVVALPGAVLPGGFTIGARKTYGQLSAGMICSVRELGIGDDHSGIIVLPVDVPARPGDDARPLVGLDDVLVEINVTPDRGYCLSVRGIARELSHALRVPLRDPATLPAAPSVPASPDVATGAPGVRVEDPAGCDRFYARRVRGFDPTAPSPAWLSRRLTQAGIRSISLAVDITNYVMLELGQPMHAWDAGALRGDLVVRRARPGERLTTLDGADRRLDPEDLVIADAGLPNPAPEEAGGVPASAKPRLRPRAPEGGTGVPVSLAAVMGGSTTEVSVSTTDVLFEAAHWDPVTVARTARRHKLPSEAAKRFERGVDPAVPPAAVARAVALLTEYAGGTVDDQVIDVYSVAPRQPIVIDADLPSRTAGVRYPADRVVALLEEIGCAVHPPSAPVAAAVGTAQPEAVAAAQSRVIGAARPGVVGAARPGVVGAAQPGVVGAAQPGVVGAARPGVAGAAQPGVVGAARPGVAGAARPGVVGAAQSEVAGAAQAVSVAASGQPLPAGAAGATGAPEPAGSAGSAGSVMTVEPAGLGASPVSAGGVVLSVTPPTWRPDLVDPADLAEEVIRLDGYDRIPALLPVAPPGNGLTAGQLRRRTVGRALAEAGYVEALCYPFVGPAAMQALGLSAAPPSPSDPSVALPSEPGLSATSPSHSGLPATSPSQAVLSAGSPSQAGLPAVSPSQAVLSAGSPSRAGLPAVSPSQSGLPAGSPSPSEALADDRRREMVRLVNPLSEEEPALRTTLLPPLLATLRRNLGRGQRDLALYELGLIFHPPRTAIDALSSWAGPPPAADGAQPAPDAQPAADASPAAGATFAGSVPAGSVPAGSGSAQPAAGAGAPPRMGVAGRPSDEELALAESFVPDQPWHAAVVLTGEIEPAGWWGPGRPADWADAVEAARIVVDTAGIPAFRVEIRAAVHAPWHPGRCAEVLVDGKVVGNAGELHPEVCAALELPRRVCAMELDLDALPLPGVVPGPRISTFPPALIDVALVVDAEVPAARVQRALVAGAGELLESVRLFDVYESAVQLGAGRKSLAYKLTFRAADRTLTVDEAVAARDAAVAEAARRVGATLRGA